MARTIGAGALTQAHSRIGAHTSIGHTSANQGRGRKQRTRQRILRSAVDGTVGESNSGRDWLGVEQLEGRVLLTASPVVKLSFSAPPDAGQAVNNSGALGAAYNGTFLPDAGGPTRTTRNNTAGDATNTQAISFNGTNQVIELAGELQPIMGRTGSLTAWIKTTQVGSANPWEAPGITGIEDAGAGDDIFWGFIDNTGRIGVQAGDVAGAKSPNPINDGLWHHVAFTRNITGQVIVYVDGVAGTPVTSGAGELGDPTGPLSFNTIGAIEDEGGVGARDEFAGELDEVLIFDRIITASEVTTIYNQGPLGGGLPNGSAPVLTAANVVGRPTAVTLNWTQATPDTNESGYEILRSTTAGGPYTVVTTVV